jgi:hypothetical protein
MVSRFLEAGEPIPGLDESTVGDFWRWAYSDVLSNINRSAFAEFIVGKALGCLSSPRMEWDSVDLLHGNCGIEVKASADCQSWNTSRPSKISFSIRKARFWNTTTGKYEDAPTRSSYCYVFCHYPEKDLTKANALDVPAWDFYVMSTALVNRAFGDQKSVSLAALKRRVTHCKCDRLKETVEGCWAREIKEN